MHTPLLQPVLVAPVAQKLPAVLDLQAVDDFHHVLHTLCRRNGAVPVWRRLLELLDQAHELLHFLLRCCEGTPVLSANVLRLF